MLKKLREQHNSEFFWLLLGAALLAGLGLRGPWPPDEPRFALIAKEMAEQGQWLFPMRGGELYADKPPLFMWAIATFYALTGDINLSFLLPSLLAACGTLYCVYDLTNRLSDERTARFACGLLAITPQFLIQAKFAQIDMWVTFWITLGIYGFIRSLYLHQGMHWFYLSFMAMGLGIISKGVGFLPLFLLIAIWGWRRYSFESMSSFQIINHRSLIKGMVLLLLVCSLWLAPMLFEVLSSHDSQLTAYRDDILFRQTAGRYADPWHHFQPWYYYVTSVIPWFWLPLVVLAVGRFRQFQYGLKQPIIKVLVTFSLLVLIFFTLSPAKRGVYILPALPPMVIILALVYRSQLLPKWLGYFQTTIVLVISALVAALGLLLLIEHPKIGLLLQEGEFEKSVLMQSGCLLTVVSISLLMCLKLPFNTGLRIFVFTTATVGTVPWILFPLLQPVRSPLLIMQKAYDVATSVTTAPQIAMIDFKEQHLLYSPYEVGHFGYSASVAEQERRAWLWLGDNKDRFVIASDDLSLQCFNLSHATTLGVAHRKNQFLLRAKGKKPECAGPDHMRVYFASKRNVEDQK